MTILHQMEERFHALKESKQPFQLLAAQWNQNEPRLAERQRVRIEALASAMVAGKPAPDTSKIDKEIADLQRVIAHDHDQGEIAVCAIAIIEAKQQAILDDMRQLHDGFLRAA
jgi:hypothetical protein